MFSLGFTTPYGVVFHGESESELKIAGSLQFTTVFSIKQFQQFDKIHILKFLKPKFLKLSHREKEKELFCFQPKFPTTAI